MVIKVLRFLSVITFGVAAYFISDKVFVMFPYLYLSHAKIAVLILGTILGAGVGYLLTPPIAFLLKKITDWMLAILYKTPTADILGGVIGAIFALIISYLLTPSLNSIPFVGRFLPIIVSLLAGYLGLAVGIKKRDDILGFFSLIPRLTGKSPKIENKHYYKILDTSVIIDGRIADIVKTGFVGGTILIPNFVLEELRHIADSSDSLKRNRGRRGLDILNKLRKECETMVKIYEGNVEDATEVDTKLLKLAQKLNGEVVTNDYNLNKVAELMGVKVLNINDLANAVKPVVLPGEEMFVQIIKDGKEANQGVAFLDDGTMIVVENGRKYIGIEMDVEVTSVLQTSAGRMIFAKPKLKNGKNNENQERSAGGKSELKWLT